jgi:hypothetical protein
MAIKKDDKPFGSPDFSWTENKTNADLNIHVKKEEKDPQYFVDDDRIDEILCQHARIRALLKECHDQCDEQLDEMKECISTEDFPLMAEACNCPLCGDGNMCIDKASIRARQGIQEWFEENFVDHYGPKDSLYDTVSAYQKAYKEESDSVLKQILKWIHENLIHLIICKPILEVAKQLSVPPLNFVGDALRDLVDLIESFFKAKVGDIHFSVGSPIGRQIPGDDEYVNPIKMGSMRDIAYECMKHQHDYNDSLNNLSHGKPWENAYNIDKSLKIYDKADADLTNLIDLNVPDGYVTANGNKKQPNTQKASTQIPADLKKKEEGIGMSTADLFPKDGKIQEMMDKFEANLHVEVLGGLNRWWRDPKSLCCLLNALIQFEVEIPDLLKRIRNILDMYKTLLNIDFNLPLKQLSDMIMNIIKGVVMKLIASLAALASKPIDQMREQLEEWRKNNQEWIDCLPLIQLIEAIINAIEALKNELMDKIIALANAWLNSFGRLKDWSYKLEMQVDLNFFINLLDMIMAFLQAIKLCQDKKKALKQEGKYEPNLPYNDADIGGDPVLIRNDGTEISIEEMMADYRNGKELKTPVANSIMKQFYVNNLNISEDKAEEIVSRREDCNCNAALTAQQISIFKAIMDTPRQ